MSKCSASLAAATVILLSAVLFLGCTSGARRPIPLVPQRQEKLFAEARFPEDLGIGWTDATVGKARPAPAGMRAVIPFRRQPGKRAYFPVIETRINDQLVLTLVEAGLSHSLLDFRSALQTQIRPLAQSDRDEAGERGPGRLHTEAVLTPFGQMNRHVALARTMSLGDLRLYNVTLGILNDNRGLQVLDGLSLKKVGAVLGDDFLRTFTRVTFDFRNGEMEIEAGAPYRPDMERLFAAIPLDDTVPVPAMRVMLEGRGPFPVVLSTGGDFGLMFSRTLAEQLDIAALAIGRKRKAQNRILPLGIHPLDLSGFALPGVRTGIRVPDEYLDAGAYAYIGNQALRDYAVTVDYSAKKVYLEQY